MPKRTIDEIIAAREAEIAELKSKREERTQAEKDKEQLARTAKIEKLDERIKKAIERAKDADAYVTKLKAERDALVQEANDAEQPKLPVDITSGVRA